jgi:HPt (histidine-containing phosphotransfer) domain-containing protein
MAGSEEMFLNNGFNGFISKPIDIMRLDVELNKWIRGKQDNEALVKTAPAKSPLPAEAEPRQPEEASSVKRGPTLDSKSTPAPVAPPQARNASGDVRVDGLDIDEGLSRYDNEDIYYGVLRTYVQSTPQLLNKIRIISRDKLPEYAITIHGIKGSSYGVCAMTAGKCAERLEGAAKRDDLETVLSENNDFIRMMERLLARIRDFIEGPAKNEEAGRPKAFAPDRQTLEKIFVACKQFDINAMDQHLMELEGIEYEYGGDLVTWLREQMDNLEYDAIKEQLAKTLTSSRKR